MVHSLFQQMNLYFQANVKSHSFESNVIHKAILSTYSTAHFQQENTLKFLRLCSIKWNHFFSKIPFQISFSYKNKIYAFSLKQRI